MDRLHVAAHTARKPHAKQKRNPSPDHAHLQKQRMNRLVLSSKLHGMQQYGRALSWPRITTQPRKNALMHATTGQQARKGQFHLERPGTYGDGDEMLST